MRGGGGLVDGGMLPAFPSSVPADVPAKKVGPVLVVDDEPNIRTFVRLALEDEGYGVVTAANGAEALELLRATNPSLILLDLRMPGMDGREFVETFRQHETAAQAGQCAAKPVPIIVVTASRLPDIDPEELGASGVLRKPFEVDVLLENVARHVLGESWELRADRTV